MDLKKRVSEARLTDKQRAWLMAYLGEARLNAVEAARMAGYAKPADSASYNLVHPGMREIIMDFLAESACSPVHILAMLRQEATSPDNDAHARIRAIELLAKAAGAFIERQEVSVKTDTEFVWGLEAPVLHREAFDSRGRGLPRQGAREGGSAPPAASGQEEADSRRSALRHPRRSPESYRI